MRVSILVCVGAFIVLVWMLRGGRPTLGLPIAYLANLLLLHVPGAIGQLLARDRTMLSPPLYTRTGIIFTAIGTVAFVLGVWLAHVRGKQVAPKPAARSMFWRYCILGGGICTVVSYLVNIPSIGAALSRGGPIWMLGLILALRSSMDRRETGKTLRWLAVLAVYPILMLTLGGFLSYGSMAVIIVLSALMVRARNPWSVSAASLVALVVGMSFFFSYFEHRPEIRAAVWGGGDTDARLDATMTAVKDVHLFDIGNEKDLYALDQRLNQNYFVGLAAERINMGAVGYLYGKSVWEGVQALVPRALWPDKPVVSGSPKVVSEMTGLRLDPNTSFGVGNVMEFHINFGIPGLIVGFVLLGWAIGRLDRLTALADNSGDFGRACLYFLPAVALIQPNGSMVEMASGAVSAVVAALAWRWAWQRWPKPVAPGYATTTIPRAEARAS